MNSSGEPASLGTGEHSCIVYERDPDENFAFLLPYIKEGLTRHHQFIYIADDQTVEQLEARLEQQGIDVRGESARGALKLWTRKEWRQPGNLDSEKKAEQVRQFIAQARQEGFHGARFAVEMTWILNPDLNAEQLAHWEATINTLLLPDFPVSIVCLYNRKRLSAEVILAGLQTHPVAVVANCARPNWFYEAPLILAKGLNVTGHTHAPPPVNGNVTNPDSDARVQWMLGQLERARAAETQRLELARTQAALAAAERARQALEASERRFRVLADSSPVLIWMSGLAGCEFVNRTFVEYFGRPEQDLLGLGWTKLIHTSDYENCLRSYQKAAETRTEFSVEFRARRADGSWRWLLTRGVPHYSADGSFIGYAGTAIDIQDQKQSDDASQRLAAIVESSDDAIVGKDLNGVITNWNQGAQRIFGYSPEEIIGQNVLVLIPADRQHEEPGILARLRRGERVDHYETVRRRKDGSLIHVSLTVSPIRSPNGQIVGASKIARDITERIRREQALQKMQQDLEKLNEKLEQRVKERTSKLAETVADLEAFSYSITHDMRAPLRSMQSFATMLEEDCAEQVSAVGKDYIRRIVTSARRMDRLILDVLAYSRLARSELSLEEVDLEPLVRGIIESYPQFQAPGVAIQIKSPLGKARANEAALTQCLSNLLSNAIKFVAPTQLPRATLWTEQHGPRITIYVQDNGIGIHPRHQERIFDIFQRLSKSYEGTGIGLSIVKKAAERMGGTVGLRSEPGQGSTFWLDLASANVQVPIS